MRSHPPILAATLLAAAATAQSFSYPDFSSTAQLNLLGNALQSGTALQLTANASNQTGWAWRQTPVPVVAGFDTTFTFRITPPAVGTKAEGMALVIHDDPNGASAVGGTVWGMGYGNGANGSVGLRNSVAIELDTYQDGFLGDTSANELTIHTRGASGNNENEQWSIARNTPTTVLSNGQVHTLRVRYVPGTIEVFVDGSATPSISRVYDFVAGGLYANNSPAPGANLVNGTAYVGFCATTGAGTLTELVQILSWDWTSTPLTHPCFEGNLGADVLTVNGDAGGFLRSVDLATWQPFTIALDNPPGYGPGAPYVLLASLLPQPGAFGTQLGFGESCFPMLPFGPTELILADTFGYLPPILPSTLTPAALPIPAGVITFPIDLTLQAITLATATPVAFGVTNALTMHFADVPAPTVQNVVPLSAAVGQTITINGAGFVPGLTLTVGGSPVAPSVQTPTQLQFAYPAGLACGSQLSVQNPDGQAATSAINPQPAVTGTLLGTGTAAGNAIFVVQGSGFAAGTTVTIGGAAATVIGASATVVTVRTPPGTPGPAVVVLTTPGGCSATTSYTYQ